jgi:hypothetical protein
MGILFSLFLNKMHQSPEFNTAGVATTCIALFNSFFSMLNPVLTGIFYMASIGWLLVQIYYKIKNKGK